MLSEIRIRGLGVIDDVTLELGPGLTVVTGETGAGKTMVVTGLHLLFGGRADPARVRSGLRAGGGRRPAAAAGRLAGAGAGPGRGRRDRRGRRAAGLPGGRGRGPVPGVPRRQRGAGRRARRAGRGRARRARAVRPAAAAAAGRAAGRAGPLRRRAGRRAARPAPRGVPAVAGAGRRPRRPHRAGPRAGPGGRPAAARAGRDRRRRRRRPGEDVALAAEAERLAHADALRLAARGAHDALAGDPADPGGRRRGRRRRCSARPAGRWRTSPRPTRSWPRSSKRLDEVAYLVADVAAELASYARARRRRPGPAGRGGGPAGGAEGADPQVRPTSVDGVLGWAADADQRLSTLDVSEDALAALAAERDAAAAEVAGLAGRAVRRAGGSRGALLGRR